MKQQTTQQTAKLISLLLNEQKQKFNNFSLESLVDLLKHNKFPYSKQLVDKLKSRNIIQRKDNGFYDFVNKEPIYYAIIERDLCDIAYKRSKVNKKYSSKIKCSESEEERSIKYLKSLGYKIFKEV